MSEAAGSQPRDEEAAGGLRRLIGRLSARLRGRSDDSQHIRDTLEEIIGEIGETDEAAMPIGSDERMMLSNILKLRHLTAYDVMVPRADIVAVDSEIGFDQLIEIMSQAGHSRLPVYRESLDDVTGMVHIKDILAFSKDREGFKLNDIARPVEVVAPSMRVLDLLLQMRIKRTHMALVVDEFGGIDGLVTIEDLVEEIVGEIEDEHDVATGPQLVWRADGTLMADARTLLEDFEVEAGRILSNREREEDIDTLGGFVFYLADRVPLRGELIEHRQSGTVFEVVQADPRRIKRLRVRNFPTRRAEDAQEQ